MKVSLRINLVCLGLAVVLAGFTSGCRTKRPEKGITVIRSGAAPSIDNPPLFGSTNSPRAQAPLPPPPEITPQLPPPEVSTTTIVPPRPPEPLIQQGTVFGNLEPVFGMIPDVNALKPNTVQFAYDSAAIAAKEMAKVKEVAIVLRGQPANKVVVDGHCDERGTEEYNRSLGERRALKVREQLMKEGISADRIYTRTFGKDKPSAFGHDEASWAQNRRGEFVLLRPATGVGAGTP